jgi:hypothetical protein
VACGLTTRLNTRFENRVSSQNRRPRGAPAFLAVMLFAACSDPRGSADLSDWDVLNEVGNPMRFEKWTWPVDDPSCIEGKDVVVLGELDSQEYSRVIAEVREAHPRDAILLVRREGRYADVLTGANCTSRGAGGGDIYLMRLEGMNWKIRGSTKW